MQTHAELRATLPEEDAITFWSRRQAAYPLLAPQDLVAAPGSTSLRGACVLRRNRLSKNLEMRVFLKLNKDLVWLYDWIQSKLVEMPANAKLLLCNIVSSKMSIIDLLINIINSETEIKTEIETEIRMMWKLTIETEKYSKVKYNRNVENL